MKRANVSFLWVAIFLLVGLPAFAETPELGGHAKYTFSYLDFPSDNLFSSLDSDPTSVHKLDLRAKGEKAFDHLTLRADVEALGFGSPDLESFRAVREVVRRNNLLPDDSANLFDLTKELSDDQQFISVGRFDRLVSTYQGEKLTLKAGRDAVSWGNGIAFQALDLFNPFSPTEIDKEYKPGVDLAFLQYLFDDGSDLQLLTIARRDPESSNVSDEESSFASKYHSSIESLEFDFDLVLAHHFDQNVFGIGVAKTVFDAVVRSDLSLHHTASAGDEVLWVTNLDRSFVMLEKNVYLYLEYFYSSFGVTESLYATPPDELSQRIERGELFTLGSQYASLGTRVELHPLWNVFGNFIVNLGESSSVLQLRSEHELSDSIELWVGANLPAGSSGEEFGGIRVPGQDFVVGSGDEGYLKVIGYF